MATCSVQQHRDLLHCDFRQQGVWSQKGKKLALQGQQILCVDTKQNPHVTASIRDWEGSWREALLGTQQWPCLAGGILLLCLSIPVMH